MMMGLWGNMAMGWDDDDMVGCDGDGVATDSGGRFDGMVVGWW